jgi:hypothetical protein
MIMPSPFPGMDPFLERPEIWSDFHDSLIAYIREVLQPLLRPHYVALTQDRLFVVESHRPIRPDISVFESRTHNRSSGSNATSVLEASAADPATSMIDFESDTIRQPYIEIIEPASGNQVITAIEVLSPDNKIAGAGQRSYEQKQSELLASGVNLVEIDLLSTGKRSIPGLAARSDVPDNVAGDLRRRYLVTVSRMRPRHCELYGIDQAQRLPRIAVPLKSSDRDVTLDLQSAFQRCYDSGPYPQLLYYDQLSPTPLSEAETTFVAQVLKH